jgi:hypothetical protein
MAKPDRVIAFRLDAAPCRDNHPTCAPLTPQGDSPMFDATLKDIAQALVDANRSGDTTALLGGHYSPDCVSVEAAQMGDMPRAAEGLEAIRGKHASWEANMEFHGGEVDGPFLFDPDRFAVHFTMDVTDKATGERTQTSEVAFYTVKDAKIVREEFFYIA